MVDLVKLVPLIEEPHQSHDYRGLHIPQFHGTSVTNQGLFGLILELGDPGFQECCTPPFRASLSHLPSEHSRLLKVRRRSSSSGALGFTLSRIDVSGSTAADFVDQVGPFRESPEGSLFPLVLMNLGDQFAGLILVVGLNGQVKQSHEDLEEIFGTKGRLFPQVHSGQFSLAKLDLGPRKLIEEARPVRGIKLVPGFGQLGHRGLGLGAALPRPVVEASQGELQARSQVLLGLVQDLERFGALFLALREPGEGEPVLQVLRVP